MNSNGQQSEIVNVYYKKSTIFFKYRYQTGSYL